VFLSYIRLVYLGCLLRFLVNLLYFVKKKLDIIYGE